MRCRTPSWSGRRGSRLGRLALGSVTLLFLAAYGGGCLVVPDSSRLDAYARRATLVTNGFTLHYHLATTNSAAWNLVFVHGTPASGGIWRSQFVRPFPDSNLLAYDRPGFGDSKPARRRPHVADQVAALTNLLAVLPSAPTILVGHSYGGPVALQAALERPDLVAGVVLIGGCVDPAEERPLWVQYPFNYTGTSFWLPGWLRQCNRELLALKGDLRELEAALPGLRVPVVMLHGGRDRQVPVANVAFLRAQLAAAGRTNQFRELVFPEYTHFIPWEHPDAVEQALQELVGLIKAGTRL
jgi:pimeloyl-ACP methyl ester carboxylesterase